MSKYTKKLRQTLPDPTNYNDSIVIVEASLGEIRGQTTFEDLDAAVRIFNARPRSPSRSTPSTPKSNSCFETVNSRSPSGFPDLPRFVTSCTVASLEVRLVAPTNNNSSVDRPHYAPPPSTFYPKGKHPHPPYDGHHPFGRRPRPSANPDESHDSFFVPWSAPEILSIEVPRIVFTSEGQWHDRSVKRTAADRLKAKRLEREARRQPDKSTRGERSGRGDETETEGRRRDLPVRPRVPVSEFARSMISHMWLRSNLQKHETPSSRKEYGSRSRNDSKVNLEGLRGLRLHNFDDDSFDSTDARSKFRENLTAQIRTSKPCRRSRKLVSLPTVPTQSGQLTRPLQNRLHIL